MAEALKVLGQVAPPTTTLTTLYTVPTAKSATISTITICNRDSTASSFRVAVSPAGEAIDNKHYVYYNQVLDGNSTFAATIGITLAATDVIRIHAANANTTFSAFGVEVS